MALVGLQCVIVVSPDHTHLLFEEKAVIDRHQFHIMATFGFFVDENQNKPSFQRYTGYLNFIKYPIKVSKGAKIRN